MTNPPANQINNKRILVTGCAGTVGEHLIDQLAGPTYQPAEVLGIDNNESALFFMEQKHLKHDHILFSLADVRDENAMQEIMQGIDIVLHCAGYKHVVMCERSPFDAVQTNIHGVQNVIKAAAANGVGRVLFTSTDKAVNPTSVMGTSKLMGERLMTAANSRVRDDNTLFSSTRFGNVLGSRGSVIPIFREQIRNGGPVTVTDKGMTRFIMSIEESAHLVLDSVDLMCGGEVFITKMPIVRIIDLAQVMIEEMAPSFGLDPKDIQIEIIGSKPGEKLYEELMSLEETRRALELKRYFAITPAFKGMYRTITYSYPDLMTDKVENPYVSEDGPFLSMDEVEKFLKDNALLDPEGEPPEYKQAARYWPGDKEE